ncbi:cytochrome C [Campylobacter sp. MIT 12-8780]|uniref:cytochrome c3 family protein n=1 Tax=unclassified Campylobacter TaxID=2593542 RepID=UPI00115E6B4B|nr:MULTISPECIES: cytochrome c3 family protein [unclassified Campylobacter]NDJ26815.1 cytochrome c3 family protein [Campylobacter sp. MIT 19-121]TQR42364.1 cytochrome C [Campylobacter sp. MIT 12-8780]
MKKLIFFLLASFSLCFAKNELFSDKVISLYQNKDDTKVIGRLLPTNAFRVVKTEGDKLLLEISGFVNPKAPSVLYFNDYQRIIVAAFSKNAKLHFIKQSKGKNGKWNRASIQMWADKADFAKSDKEMLARASSLYTENCGICHTAHKINEFTANAWPAVFRSMADRTGIDKADRWLVIEYLQKNAKDFKKGK